MYGGFSGTYSDGAGQHDDDSDVTTLDATYLVAKEAKTALEETRKVCVACVFSVCARRR